jgi:ERCC4-type nuclease
MEKTLLTILIDRREQNPLVFQNLPSERATLPVGDYGIRAFSEWENPAFILERKSLPDLCHSLGKDRERFLRECEKMRGFRFRGLVIEAVQDQVELAQYRSLISPAAILSTLDALAVRAGIHVFWCGDSSGAARKVESLARMFCRGVEKDYWRLTAPAVLEGQEKVA